MSPPHLLCVTSCIGHWFIFTHVGFSASSKKSSAMRLLDTQQQQQQPQQQANQIAQQQHPSQLPATLHNTTNNNLPLKPLPPPASVGLSTSLSAGALSGVAVPKQPFAQDSCMPLPVRPDSRTQVDEVIRRLHDQTQPSPQQQQQLIMSR